MGYIRENVPLWSITIWDKKFNNVDKNWQPSVRKYKYLLADELEAIKVKNGDVKVLYTGKDTGFTTEELAGDSLAEGEIVAIPWGGIPTVKYFKGKFVTGDNRIATSSDTSQLLNKYLYYFMRGNIKTIASFYRGASLKHPSMKDVLNMRISLPSIDEQDSIIKSLDCLERLIEGYKQELSLLDDLIKARFVEMFGDCDNKTFIGDVISISRGASPRPISSFITDGLDGVNWIKIGDVSENSLYITNTEEKITPAGAKKSRMVHKGDFILSNSMSFGRPYILEIDGCVHDGWLIMSDFKETFNELYLYYAIRSEDVQYQFNGKVNGATVKNLNSELVKNTLIKVPPMNQQELFAKFVKQVDKSKFKPVFL